ncbi:hypothetical protein [Lentzea flava]|uniref:Uncharacterized protein n=1 Tax=Lentzea flava TaxID=103732 RepID=A0ABQ2V270_9PSEU|nr:hypothetical protein [Lentzea flava]MCP2202721.1 hypothetical protein [Lentzea flava]GGU61669.1 hypothetical protein GCM10010178_62300 [Lentzea flava]
MTEIRASYLMTVKDAKGRLVNIGAGVDVHGRVTLIGSALPVHLSQDELDEYMKLIRMARVSAATLDLRGREQR